MLSCATIRSSGTSGKSAKYREPVQPALLARVPDEQQRPLRPRALRERAGERHQRHRARAVVVRAVPDAIVERAGADAPGRLRAPAVAHRVLRVADVVVVRAERDVGVPQRGIRALDEGDHVLGELGPDDRVVGVDVERERHAGKLEVRQRILRGGLPRERVVGLRRAAEQKRQHLGAHRDRRRPRAIEPLDGRKIHRSRLGGRAGPTRPAGRRVRGRAYRRGGAQLVGGVPRAAGQDAAGCRVVHPLRRLGAEPHDGGARHVPPAEILVRGRGHVQPVAGEHHAVDRQMLGPAHVARERDARAVGEGARGVPDAHREARAAGRLDPVHANGLQVGPAVAGRRHAPGGEVGFDVPRGQPDARAEHRAALELVGRDVAEPLAEVAGGDGGPAAGSGGQDGRPEDQGGDGDETGATRRPHGSSGP